LKMLWSVSIIDFMVWIVAFLATVLLDVDLGLGVAVIFAILIVVCRSQRPYTCLLGQMPGTFLYRDINIYSEAKEIPGFKIFQFDQSLFFVNAEHFRSNLYKRCVNPRNLKIKRKKRQAKLDKQLSKEMKPLQKKPKKIEIATGIFTPNIRIRTDIMELEVTVGKPDEVQEPESFSRQTPECPPDVDFHTIILDCSSWSFVDSMAVKVLTAVIGEFHGIGVEVCLANVKGGIRDMFLKTRFYETLDHSRIYASIHDAVVSSLHLESPTRTQRVSTLQREFFGLPKVSKVNFADEVAEFKEPKHKEDASLTSDDTSED